VTEFEQGLLLAAYIKQRFILEKERAEQIRRAAHRFEDFRLKSCRQKSDESKAFGSQITNSAMPRILAKEECATN